MKSLNCASHIIRIQNVILIKIHKYSTVIKTKKPPNKVITMDNLNPRIVQMEYALQSPIKSQGVEIEKEANNGVVKPFKKVINMHIEDCHVMGQVPVSFVRQVLACVINPELIQKKVFLADVTDRASHILSACGGRSIGSYSQDIGYEMVRQSVAEFIKKRDGFKADFKNVYLIPGARIGIKGCLQLLVNNIDGKESGVMVPVPRNPFYSATLTELGLRQVNYYLDESKNWQLTEKELENSFEEGSKSSKIRAIVVINPGNPSGQVFSKTEMETLVKFAQNKSLFIFADEVCQQNIYKGEFHSFKKMLMELGNPYNETELVSFMSASYGYTGEAGIRGGWMEIVNMDPNVQYNLFKCISARLCPSTLGQTVIECIARPPINGDPSYEQYLKEKTKVLLSFYDKANIIEDIFRTMEGFSFNTIQGGLYAYPRIAIPHKAVEAAKKAGLDPDKFYSLKLLKETGICAIPGSVFGQITGSYHIGTSILPHSKLLKEIGSVFRQFHARFSKEFS